MGKVKKVAIASIPVDRITVCWNFLECRKKHITVKGALAGFQLSLWAKINVEFKRCQFFPLHETKANRIMPDWENTVL